MRNKHQGRNTGKFVFEMGNRKTRNLAEDVLLGKVAMVSNQDLKAYMTRQSPEAYASRPVSLHSAPQGIGSMKRTKLEQALDAPVKLTGRKKRRIQVDAANTGGQPDTSEQKISQPIDGSLKSSQVDYASVPDLSGVQLPGTKRRVSFAEPGVQDDNDIQTAVATKQKHQKQGKPSGIGKADDTQAEPKQSAKKGESNAKTAVSRTSKPEANGVKAQQQSVQKEAEHVQPDGSKSGKKGKAEGKQPAGQTSQNINKAVEGKLEDNQLGRKQNSSQPQATTTAGKKKGKQQKSQSHDVALHSQVEEHQTDIQPQTKQQKKRTRNDTQQDQLDVKPTSEIVTERQAPSSHNTKGAGSSKSSLLDKMRERLAGGRFRSLNEQLYTCSGKQAYSMMQEDPSLFEQYHSGFEAQTKGWPQQPVDLAAKWLSSRPTSLTVVDFGCGTGRLATIVKQKVHSFDLISSAPHVVACNMASVPLETGSADVAVFSLALMGTDYGLFLSEAARVLRHKGWLWIAEVRSRFAGEGSESNSGGSKTAQKELQPFLNCLGKLGFHTVSLDTTSNTMFFVVVLRKVNVASCKPADIQWPALKACVYKKR